MGFMPFNILRWECKWKSPHTAHTQTKENKEEMNRDM